MHMQLTIQGQSVPAIGLGTWELRGGPCRQAVKLALELGYRHIDTAQMYLNEAEVGRGMEEASVPRDEIFLVTKVWPDDFARDRVLKKTEQSLRDLRTDYADLLLMHWPGGSVPIEETLGAMEELRHDGKVRQIGVSNFSTSQVDEAARSTTIFCNQIKYSPYDRDEEVLQQSQKMNYLLTAYTPLARGRVAQDRILSDIGLSHGKTAAQVALRWLLQQGICVIPKASGETHLKENLNIFDFQLSDDEKKQVANECT